jgi:amino acid transporter
MNAAARQGWNVFFWVMDQTVPAPVKFALYAIIFAAQLLAGLATVTSVSRMIFAFARDDGLPASALFKKVSPRFRTPVAAIWVGVVLAVAFTLYADAYSTVVSVTSIALYLSYAMPIAAGLLAYGRSWKRMGPWDMGPSYRIVAGLCIVVALGIFYVGVQPPNGKALTVLLAIFGVTGAIWLLVERRRFRGPPARPELASPPPDLAVADSAV